jgi:hypothetical protein
MMYESHFRPDPRIAGMGLGFWLGRTGGHRFAEHGGVLPGFHSQIFVAPDDGVGVMAFTNGSRGAMFWLPGTMGRILDDILAVRSATIRTDVPQQPRVWDDCAAGISCPGRSPMRGRDWRWVRAWKCWSGTGGWFSGS